MPRFLISLALFLITVGSSRAHFIWIVPEKDGNQAKVVFSDSLEPDEGVAIDKITAVKLSLRDLAGKVSPIDWKKGESALLVKTPGEGAYVVGGICQYGVLKKSEAKPFLLAYYPKWVRGDVKSAAKWDHLPLEILAEGQGHFRVLFNGQPVAGADVVVHAPEKETFTTDARGEFKIKATAPGLYGLRARHIEAKAGDFQGKKYDEIRHYATLVFQQPKAQSASIYPPLPQAFSSFGAAVADGHVYVYGGHVAKTHTYSTEAVTGNFRRLNLADPSKGWEELATGPALQGLALVAHQGKLYRIGGMQPRNKVGEPADNYSTASCDVFDPATGKWHQFLELPAGRSSHDATMVGDLLVVVGGWHMKGQGEKSAWHDSTLVVDLAKKPWKWQEIKQPFLRRALNVANLDGKVFVVGGMASDNVTEKTVDVLDPIAKTWTQAPELPGPTRNGFTPAACTSAGRLYVGPSDGKVYRLTTKKDAWEEIAVLEKQRTVHRIAPLGDRLLVLGGASRMGNVAHTEAVELAPQPVAADRSTTP